MYSVLQHVSNVIEQQLEIEQHVQLLHLSCLVVKGNARAKLGILTMVLEIQFQQVANNEPFNVRHVRSSLPHESPDPMDTISNPL